MEQPGGAARQREQQVELVLSYLLRGGVFLSLALVLLGTAITFVHHRDYLSTTQSFDRIGRPGATFPHTPRTVVDGLADLRGQAVVTIGLVVLIATPIVRVGVSIIAFVYQRDRIFVVITSLVFLLLITSLLLGKASG